MTSMRQVIVAALALAGTAAAAPERHVRVILDTSQSMRGTRSEAANDPSGLALISSAMLYDLAKYELGADGLFKLLTFDTGSGSGCPGSVPRTVANTWIGVTETTRSDFVNKVLGLRYDAPCTYFYPYLAEAARDLETTRAGDDVKRMVVLITDGLTEARTEAEEERLLGELAPRYRTSHIDLYVLAFGPTANTNAERFRRIFGLGQAGGVGGQVLADPSGRDLVDNMISIFKAAFAYQSDVVPGDALDLAGGARRRAVAVLGRYDSPVEPAFSITAPPSVPGGVSLKGESTAVGRPVPDVSPKGSSHPISYGIQWLVGPDLGEHRLVTKGPRPRQVAILRPINILIRIEAAPPAPSQVAMVDAPMRLRAIVTPAEGGGGDPGAVTVQFRALAVKTADGYAYAPTGGWGPGSGTGAYVKGVGRVYDIQPVFVKSAAFRQAPRDGKAFYDGYVEARAQVDGNEVASTPNPHQVRIYPWVSMQPEPERATAARNGSKTLTGGDTGCADFSFHIEGAVQKTDYTLSAAVDRAALRGGLSGSEVYLDGVPVKAWENGRKIGYSALGARKFTACLSVARRTSGGKDLEIPIRFSLWQAEDDPYKQLDVVQPFHFMANLEAAGFLQRWNSLLLLFLTLLILALLYWLLNRLGFPNDFRIAVGSGLGPAGLETKPPPNPGLLGTLNGGVFPVFAQGGNRQIGTVKPLQEDLYAFRPDPGYRQLSLQQGAEWVEVQDSGEGERPISAHKLYRVRDSAGTEYYFKTSFELQPEAGR